MSETVIVALLSLVGTLVGSFAGIIAANKLINYRLQQLEKKVDKHNSVVERTYDLESRMSQLETEVHIYHHGGGEA